jgi:predicted O-methyltransferase YrrM
MKMKTRRYFLLILQLTVACLAASAQSLTVNAPSHVEAGENFRLTYTVNTQDAQDFRIGNVLTGLPDDEPPFDLVFIDGNKRQYTEYYELSLKHLNDGGFILADNTLWDGHVVDTAYDRDAQTLGIRRFNELVARDHRVETVIIPLRDGLTLLRKR